MPKSKAKKAKLSPLEQQVLDELAAHDERIFTMEDDYDYEAMAIGRRVAQEQADAAAAARRGPRVRINSGSILEGEDDGVGFGGSDDHHDFHDDFHEFDEDYAAMAIGREMASEPNGLNFLTNLTKAPSPKSSHAKQQEKSLSDFNTHLQELVAAYLGTRNPSILPVKAFSCKLMESASREMDQHMSNQGALRCQVPGLSPNDEKNLTKHLAAALVQFRQIKNRIRHCHLFESVVAEYGVGRVQCPCIGSPFKQHGCVKIRVGDGNFSAKSLSVASGGGGNYGRTPFSKEYFVEAVECGDPKDSAHSGCGNHFKSGSNATVSKSERLDLGGIFFVNCRHEVTETVMNIKKGEGLKYADTACLLAQLPEELRPVKEIKPEWITQRPEIPAGTQRGVRIFTFRTEEAVDKFINQLPSFLFAYDIICQHNSHTKKFSLWFQPKIGLFPVLHAFAHEGSCRLRFLSRLSIGGGTGDFEGNERTNGAIHRGVAITQGMTDGNREFNLSMLFEVNSERKIAFLIPALDVELNGCINAIRAITESEDFRLISYADAIAENKNRRQALFTSRSVVAMAKGMLENVSVDAVAKRNMLLRMKAQMEQLAAHIRECDLKLKRHQGTNLTASVRRSRNKEYKKLVDLVDVWNEFIQDPAQELTDLEGILESTTLDISELALDGLPDLLDQDEFDTEETEANAASRVDVGQEGVGRKDVASQSTMESLSSRITFWRLIEQVYFIHSDLHNIVYFYEDRMERFWASVMHELGEERDAAFRDAARVVIEKRRLWENTRMEEARKLIEFYENLEDFPKSALLQVENATNAYIRPRLHSSSNNQWPGNLSTLQVKAHEAIA
ncbi:hypothetical protein HDU99_001486 [Rhizoclosmatium hyalinum]|nr:hypothetical protein HDU99_001486 [Rhizoclosmatium hyalinum]